MKVIYRTQTVGDVEVFYREAGPKDRPMVLLLHGFPTSSHMFRELIPELAEHYRVVAPDLPGSEIPGHRRAAVSSTPSTTLHM
jgi:pimeloyl-ACP methyl ester carboxylesterase